MKRSLKFTAALLAVAGAVAAADWPQWRGPARDGVAPGLAARSTWPATLTRAWTHGAGAGHASPVVAHRRVFLFSRIREEETLQAFDLGTGKRIWREAYPAPYSVHPAATGHGAGPKSTPAVANGHVFTFGIDGILSAHDATSGRLLWRKEFARQFPETSPTYGAAQSPLVDGGRVIVHVGGPGSGALTAFDAKTGTVAWSWKGDGPGYASPIAADLAGVRQVVTFTESMLVGLDAASGALLWKRPFTTAYAQNAVTPAVHGDLVVVSGLDHPIQALRVRRAGTTWTAEPAWENPDVALYMSSPVISAGRVFGLSHKRKGQFFSLDATTGRTIWLSEGRQGENASLAVAGNVLLALTTASDLLVIDPTAPEFKLLRRYSVANTPTWAHLAVVDGGVLVKDVEMLAYLRF